MNSFGSFNKYILLLLFFLFGRTGWSQSYTYFDTLSLRWYQQKRLDSLIRLTDKAISIGYDGYYLRIRRGLAYYNDHQYTLAAKELKQALEYNSRDPLALEYLYYSLTQGKFYRKAQWLTRQMPYTMRKNLELQHMPIVELVQAGAGFENHFLPPGEPAPIQFPKSPQYSTSILTSSRAIQAMLKLNLACFSLTSKVSYTTNSLSKYFFNNKILVSKNDYSIDEKGFLIKPSFYVRNKIYSFIYAQYKTHSTLQEVNQDVTNKAGGLNIKVIYTPWNDHYLSITVLGSKINQRKGLGGELLYFYSLNHKNLYGSSMVNVFSDTQSRKNMFFEQGMYVYGKGFSLSFYLGIGSIKDMASHELFYFYTYPSIIKFYAGVETGIKLLGHLWLQGKCIYMGHHNIYLFSNPDVAPFQSPKIFSGYLINGGIIWK